MMLKCSLKAYAMCPYRNDCGSISGAIFSKGSECDKFNCAVEDMPMTNSERIRAMSDEELGVFLGDWAANSLAWKQDGSGQVLAWLQEPVKE